MFRSASYTITYQTLTYPILPSLRPSLPPNPESLAVLSTGFGLFAHLIRFHASCWLFGAVLFASGTETHIVLLLCFSCCVCFIWLYFMLVVHVYFAVCSRYENACWTANLRTKILDFRGFDSSIILVLRGWNSQAHGEFLGWFESSNLSRDNLSWEIGRISGLNILYHIIPYYIMLYCYVYLCVYVYIYMYICIHIYIYIYRERERCVYVYVLCYVCMYIYIYIYIYIHTMISARAVALQSELQFPPGAHCASAVPL